jgi:hypothetical protein
MTLTSLLQTGRNGLIVASLLGIAACGSSPKATPTTTPTTDTTPQQAAQNAVQAGQQAAQAMQQMAGQTQTATTVDFEKLVELIPEVSGWTRSKPRGEQASAMGFSYSTAKTSYEKGDSSLQLEITDTAFSKIVLAPVTIMMGAGWAERSSDGYKKAQAVNGQPGFESWENDPKDGEITVLVANRFIVNAKGRGVDSIETVRALAQAVDFNKLAALK